MNTKYFMYIGTFTHQFKTASGELMGAPADGIDLFAFDASTGSIEHVETFGGLFSPTWLAFHPKLPVLYGIERRFDVEKAEPGALASYDIDEETGHLTQTSRVTTEGRSPPYVSVHPTGGHAYGVHFESGHVVGFPLDASGKVGPVDTRIQHVMDQTVPEGVTLHHHQHSPHPHQIIPAPNGRYVTVSDVGTNLITTYPTDPADGKLSPTPSHRLRLPQGTGPRHHARHPSGKYLFTCGEINNSMSVMSLSEQDGELRFLAAYPTLPSDYVEGPEHVGTAELVVHPSGRAVYVSNRGHDSIAMFSFDEATGKAEFKGTQSSNGVTPRAFSIDPTGTFMIVANQTPGSLVQYRINPQTYWPEPTGLVVETPTPVCVVFRPRKS